MEGTRGITGCCRGMAWLTVVCSDLLRLGLGLGSSSLAPSLVFGLDFASAESHPAFSLLPQMRWK